MDLGDEELATPNIRKISNFSNIYDRELKEE
jgi:hypothetical protein